MTMQSMDPTPPKVSDRWALAIFSSRESLKVLHKSIAATVAAAHAPMVIDVLVNGNPTLATELSRTLPAKLDLPDGVAVRVWRLSFGDKAHAWNEYLHTIWAGEALAFFCDGYVRPHSDSISLLGNAVMTDAFALGGSGVPEMGRTAEKLRSLMLTEGGMHGNFCCIRGDVISEWKHRKIMLPLGLYRTDSLVSAILAFNLDPQSHRWDKKRILAHSQASWSVDPKHWWRLADVKAQVKRALRQGRGMLENAAVRAHFKQRKLGPEHLPLTVDELVCGWASNSTLDYRKVLREHPLCYFAMKHFQQPKDYANAQEASQLVWASSPK